MRTIIWFAYFWAYLLCLIPSMRKAQKLETAGDTKGRDAILDREITKWAKRLMRLAGVTVTVEGQENISDEPVVFVSNHQGYFDIPLLLTYLDRPHGMVAKDAIEKMPLVRDWMRLLGCVFIDRSNARQSVTALGVAAKALTEEGRSFIIFPEGTRNRGGELLEFKNGAFKIAFKAGVPILPVCIDGTFRVMEAHGGWIKPAAVKLTILPPIPTSEMSREQTKLIGDRVRTLIADKIRS
ncbi:MAG: lysophospholipid acyltransferase family protein [Angelakisella sp.]